MRELLRSLVIAVCPLALACSGSDGLSAVVDVTEEPAGDNCANGGLRVDHGLDGNDNGVLEPDEIDDTSYICDGAPGESGADGADGENGADGAEGAQSLVSVVDEPAGANCASGGERIDYGIDDDGDGVLDPEEIDGTTYVCDGTETLVAVSDEPAGGNCASGGQRVDHGADDDGDGVLDAGEIDGTSYVCDGSDGLQSLIATTTLPAGDVVCSEGGVRIDHGIDDDGDGTLDEAEIDGTDYVCGAAAPAFYTAVGPQRDVPAANLVGWSECFSETYGADGTPLADVQAACTGSQLMLACRATGSATFQLLAHAPRADVLFVTSGNTPHDANGSGWYFNDQSSWGFAPQGAAIALSSCDTVDSALTGGNTGGTGADRLCWHLNPGALEGGWRCGTSEDLNSSTAFERVVLEASF